MGRFRLAARQETANIAPQNLFIAKNMW